MITKDLKFKKAADWIGLKLGKYLIKEKLGRGGKGIVFKVQLGAFQNKDLKKYDNSPNFSAEESGDLQKYTIGVFRDYWEADTFKKYLREMGVKDAWVVSYKDGQRVPIKDVLEGVTKKS